MDPYVILHLDDEGLAYRQMRETLEKKWTADFLHHHWNAPVTLLQAQPLPKPVLRTHEDFGPEGLPGLRQVVSDLHDGDRAGVLDRIDVLVLDLDFKDLKHSVTQVRLSGAILGEQVVRRAPWVKPILLSQHHDYSGPESVELKTFHVRGLGPTFPKGEVIGWPQSDELVALFFMAVIKHAEMKRNAKLPWTKDRFQRLLVLKVEEHLPVFEEGRTGDWRVGRRSSKRAFVQWCSKFLVELYEGKIPEGCYPKDQNAQQLLKIVQERRDDLYRRLCGVDPGR